VWDVVGKILFAPAKLETWAVVDFALVDSQTLGHFIGDLTKTMRERGQYCLCCPYMEANLSLVLQAWVSQYHDLCA